MSNALNAFTKKTPTTKAASISHDDPLIHQQILEYAQAKKLMDAAEAKLKGLKPELRDLAVQLYAEHNVTTDQFTGNVNLVSPHAELRVNLNNGYKVAPSSDAIKDAETAIGKRLKHLFTLSTVATLDFDMIEKESRAAFEKEFTALCEKHNAVQAVTVKEGNVVVADFNQKVIKLLTPDEILVLDQTLAIPATFTIVRLDSPETIAAANLMAEKEGAK